MKKHDEPIVVSFGGGVNSTAMLIAMRDRNIIPDAILFSDTGGEKPETYDHVREMSAWVIANRFPEITRVSYSTSRHESLESECLTNGTLPSKAFGFSGCSVKWKRQPMDRWVKEWRVAQEHWNRGGRIVRAIGIHAGETRRGRIPDDQWFAYWYPLREFQIDQSGCENLILREGLRIPVKSACFFCPAMKAKEVIQLSVEHPELVQRAIAMEQNAKECDGLEVVKGLGRTWSWESLLRQDREQMRLFPDEQAPMCDVCVDW